MARSRAGLRHGRHILNRSPRLHTSFSGTIIQRFILTGAPGAGKTTVVRRLADLGFETVPEAATDIIAEQQANGIDAPWTRSGFTDRIARLQERRIEAAAGLVQFHDRSPICTYALAQHLGVPVPDTLKRLLDRIVTQHLFESTVFFVESLDFVERTAARRIGPDEAQKFGALHARIYGEMGYGLVPIPAGPPQMRAELIRAQIVT